MLTTVSRCFARFVTTGVRRGSLFARRANLINIEGLNWTVGYLYGIVSLIIIRLFVGRLVELISSELLGTREGLTTFNDSCRGILVEWSDPRC